MNIPGRACLAAALLGAALTACAPAPPTSPAANSPPAPVASPSTAPLASPRGSFPQIAPPSAPTPIGGSSLLAVLECDAPPSSIGGLAEKFGPGTGGATANAAFADWAARNPFALPRQGYVIGWADEERALYVYSVWGRVKVAVLISTRLGNVVGRRFTVDEVRACDPGEFGSGAVAGQREWRNAASGEVLLETTGSEHCAWQSIRFLDLVRDGEARQYVRDPLSLLPGEALDTTLARGVDLPDGAWFSGYRSAQLELWLTPTDEAAYIVSPTETERWPRAREPLGCV